MRALARVGMVVLLGCKAQVQPTPPAGEPAVADEPTNAAEEPANAPPDEPASAPVGEVGVAACDSYVEFMSRCIEDHAAEDIKPQLRDALAKTVEAWKEQPDREELARVCAAATQAVQSTLDQWGCDP